MSRIAHAFCVQLNRLVTIDEARCEFRHIGDIERFDFLCAEPACAPYKIRIAGVNYRVDAATGRKYVENHFRRWDDHLPGCPYADVPPHVETAEEAGRDGTAHRSRALASELVDAFDPPVDDLPGFERSAPTNDETPDVHHTANIPARPRAEQAPLRRHTRSASLARLVDSYREAVRVLTPQELAQRRLAVTGDGWIPLTRYLVPIGHGHEGPPLRVHYGGARLIRYYGRGFKLRFYDRFHGKPVYLYVASAAVRTAAESAVLLERLDAMERGEYSTVYALGRLDASLDGASYSIAVTDLRRLVLHAPRVRHVEASSLTAVPS